MAMVETTSGVPRRICDTGNTLSVGATTDVRTRFVCFGRRWKELTVLPPARTELPSRPRPVPANRTGRAQACARRQADCRRHQLALHEPTPRLGGAKRPGAAEAVLDRHRPPLARTSIGVSAPAVGRVPSKRADIRWFQRPPPLRRGPCRLPRSCVTRPPRQYRPANPSQTLHSHLPSPPPISPQQPLRPRPPRPRRHNLQNPRLCPLARRHLHHPPLPLLRALRQHRRGRRRLPR